MSCGCEHEHNHEEENAATGVANPAVIDLFGLDQQRDEVLLVMREDRLWEGSDDQLHDVQEKFNAYVSFLLDGEMLAAHPELQGKKARIELHSASMPDERGIALLEMIHEQLELQDIGMEVIVADAGSCGAGCACHGS